MTAGNNTAERAVRWLFSQGNEWNFVSWGRGEDEFCEVEILRVAENA